MWTVNGTAIASGASPTVSFAPGIHFVTLTVTDNLDATDTDTVTITVNANQSPTADAGGDQIVTDVGNDGEVVVLDGSNSTDADGVISSYAWVVDGDPVTDTYDPVGDGIVAVTLAVGSHAAQLTVMDNGRASGVDTAAITVTAPEVPATMHVAMLDGATSGKGNSGRWAASVTVTVVDQAGAPVSGATVTGAWSGALSRTATGVTGSDGKVTLSTGNIKSGTSVTFAVTNITHSNFTYDQAANNVETSITLSKP
jgi:hypothetical protein